MHTLIYAGHFDVLPVPYKGAGWIAAEPVFHLPTIMSNKENKP
jgi:hypothetical protein